MLMLSCIEVYLIIAFERLNGSVQNLAHTFSKSRIFVLYNCLKYFFLKRLIIDDLLSTYYPSRTWEDSSTSLYCVFNEWQLSS